jgi:hypothetical protein
MATQKNNWLNAKPVTRTGGKSGGVRKPNKPYSKPPAKPKAETPARWDAKTKSERLQQAAKTKPSSPAPRQVVKKPVTRTGPVKGPVAPKGSTGPVTMPNSKRAGVNLPQTGARAERTSTRANQLIKDARAKAASAPKPSPASTPKPSAPAASAVSRVGSGASRLAGGASKLLGRAAVIPAIAGEVKAMSDRNKTFSWNRDKVKPDANGRGSRGVNTSNGRSVPTGSQQYNDYRNQQIAAERQRLKGVGNPPAAKPKPPASTQSGGGSTPSRGGGGTSQASQGRSSTAQRSQTASAAPQSGPKRVSAATANRESGNYGTSRTNNPLIDADMKARMRQREDREGVGPVKDGARYSADVKNNTKGVGPVKNADTYSSALKQKSGSEKLKDAISKQRDEQQRRKRNAG